MRWHSMSPRQSIGTATAPLVPRSVVVKESLPRRAARAARSTEVGREIHFAAGGKACGEALWVLGGGHSKTARRACQLFFRRLTPRPRLSPAQPLASSSFSDQEKN